MMEANEGREKSKGFGRSLAEALVVFGFLAAATGLLYPAVTTGAARMLMPERAGGSLIVRDAVPIGSELIGQASPEGLFEGRPSAADWNAAASAASNLGPTNPKLLETVRERVERWRTLRGDEASVPSDLVTASASGLDPHLSLAAALYQVPVVARRTGLSESDLERLIEAHVEKGLFGRHDVVNVVRLNMGVLSLLKGGSFLWRK